MKYFRSWKIGILEYWSNGAQILKYLGAKGQSHKMRTITGIYSCRTQEICSGLNDGNEDKIFIFYEDWDPGILK